MREQKIKNILINDGLTNYFISKLMNKKYRGNHVFQHTRTTIEQYMFILKTIDGLLEIPNGDEYNPKTHKAKDKRYELGDFPQYAKYFHSVQSFVGGSPDAIKKILFVNLARMGYLNRMRKDKNGNMIYCSDQMKRFRTQYVSLTEKAHKLLALKTDKEKIIQFGKDAISFETSQQLNDNLIKLFSILEYITLNEFMLFVSYIDVCDDNYTLGFPIEECVNLINAWRELSKIQRDTFMDFLKNESKAKLSKTSLLHWDFGNWRNQSQTIFYTFKDLGLFLIKDNKIFANGIAQKDFKRVRDRNVVSQYKKHYSISDTPKGWEYHHVYQVAAAYDIHSLNMIDNYKNIVLISGTFHNYFPKRGNLFVKMEYNASENKVIFRKNDKEFYEAVIGKDILVSNIDEQLEYNQKLLAL